VTGVLPSTSKTFQSFVDRIYAGDPQKGFDCYYNHSAAYEAGLKWVPGESTGYDTKGGQMLARKAAYSKGDEVEVYYEPEDKWYASQITKVKQYDDDIRYVSFINVFRFPQHCLGRAWEADLVVC
jgi:hypothetical protein